MTKYVSPSTAETAFSCPYCGAFTTQHWFNLLARENNRDSLTPNIPDAARRHNFATRSDIPEEIRPHLLELCDKTAAGNPFFENIDKWQDSRKKLHNLNLSECYNCNKLAVWVHTGLVHPNIKIGVMANPDLPLDIQSDFEEARTIINASPRGAAALLRLCVQKLCAHLGEKGKDIDADIANLVKKGLNPLVQQALDIVRVVGNEAVHPGTLNIQDDQATAIQLLELVNAIADQMISHPKSVQKLYEKLPETKRAAIKLRDGKTKEAS